jgi:hypothetical protein
VHVCTVASTEGNARLTGRGMLLTHWQPAIQEEIREAKTNPEQSGSWDSVRLHKQACSGLVRKSQDDLLIT